MKNLFLLLMLSAIAFIADCKVPPTAKKKLKITSKIILKEKAICFIKRFKDETDYAVPEAWLFEKDSINLLLNPSPGDRNDGLRFYAAINNSRNTNSDTLTLIMVPVKINSNTYIKQDNTEGALYEFADICPTICKKNYTGNIYMKDSEYKLYTIPRAWYFDGDIFKNIFMKNPAVVGIRLRQYIDGNIINLKVVPVIKDGDYYQDMENLILTNVADICLPNSASNCDTDSELYKAEHCTE